MCYISFKFFSSITTISEVDDGSSGVVHIFYLLNTFVDIDPNGSSVVTSLLSIVGLNDLNAEFVTYPRSCLRVYLVGGPTYLGCVSKKSSNLSFNFSPPTEEVISVFAFLFRMF